MDTNIKPRATIVMDSVESSQIAAIGHDPKTNTLAVKFPANKKGVSSVYHYANFDAEQFEIFKQSESKGAHFGRNIKPNTAAFPFENVTDLYANPAPEAA